MATKPAADKRRTSSHPIYLNEGLTPKKTALIIVTVIGCIAILWPKVFYPMMFGSAPAKAAMKEPLRGSGGCCGVTLNGENFLNATSMEIGPQVYRKTMNLYTGEISLRQERPAHLHPESIYQAMRERGRAIPASMPSVPIVDRKGSPSNPPPRIVEGRPGPIPGMRPPMGGGALHQPQPKGSSMGIIMPLYTVGIIVFFGYTIMKLVCKKPIPNAPYGPAPSDPNFRKEVFGKDGGRHVEDLQGPKLGTTTTATNLHPSDTRNESELYNASLSAANAATNLSISLQQHHHQHMHQRQQQIHQQLQHLDDRLGAGTNGAAAATAAAAGTKGTFNKEVEQLMEIEKLRKKLEDTERAMAKLIAEMNSDQYEAKDTNESTTSTKDDITSTTTPTTTTNGHTQSDDEINEEQSSRIEEIGQQEESKQRQKRREGSSDRSVAILGMEVTASCEGGHKWTGRPPTPVFSSHYEHSKDEDMPEPQSIYLEGTLAHESQILVADSETKREEVYDEELNGSGEEPAVVISSKMTLSLINLDSNELHELDRKAKADLESPLADDIEIISHDEK